MSAKSKTSIRWRKQPDDHNYQAATSYLTLLHSRVKAGRLVAALRRAPLTEFMAKDIFRASQLSLLGISNSQVERDLEKIRDGGKLSPLLLVRDEAHGKVVIADGYHRLCAVYSLDEDAWIPCKIV